MNNLPELPLATAIAISSWHSAPIGKLLHVSIDAVSPRDGVPPSVIPRIVMRTQIEAPMGNIDGVLIVSGVDCGRFVPRAHVKMAALDLDHLIDLEMTGLSHIATEQELERGNVYADPNSGDFHLWGEDENPNGPRGWFCIRAAKAAQIGAYQRGANGLYCVAKGLSAKPKP